MNSLCLLAVLLISFVESSALDIRGLVVVDGSDWWGKLDVSLIVDGVVQKAQSLSALRFFEFSAKLPTPESTVSIAVGSSRHNGYGEASVVSSVDGIAHVRVPFDHDAVCPLAACKSFSTSSRSVLQPQKPATELSPINVVATLAVATALCFGRPYVSDVLNQILTAKPARPVRR
ncbi:hypothetical protein DIPPA_18487 [Diplonema papillatum]|nr:hypothetical protein DIPPA_18487 [Diplonema papillatum]